MNITLEVNPGDLNVEFLRLMDGVNEEQRMALVERVMLAWIFQARDKDLEAFVAMEEERCKNSYLGGYSLRDRISSYQSPREKMLTAMAEGIVAGARTRTMAMMESDSRLDSLWEKSRDFIVSRFPEMVQSAMVRWFAGRFGELSDSIVGSYSDHGKGMADDLAQHLGIVKR